MPGKRSHRLLVHNRMWIDLWKAPIARWSVIVVAASAVLVAGCDAFSDLGIQNNCDSTIVVRATDDYPDWWGGQTTVDPGGHAYLLGWTGFTTPPPSDSIVLQIKNVGSGSGQWNTYELGPYEIQPSEETRYNYEVQVAGAPCGPVMGDAASYQEDPAVAPLWQRIAIVVLVGLLLALVVVIAVRVTEKRRKEMRDAGDRVARSSEVILKSLPEVTSLMNAEFAAIDGDPPSDSPLHQGNLRDGSKVVVMYIGQREPELALDHLIYMIAEASLPISHETYNLVDQAGRLLNMDPSQWRDLQPPNA